MNNGPTRDNSQFVPDLLMYARFLLSSSPRYDISMAEELTQQIMARAHDPADKLCLHLEGFNEPIRIKKYLKQALKHQFIDQVTADSRTFQTLNLIRQHNEEPLLADKNQIDTPPGSPADKAVQSMCMRFAAMRQSLDTLTETWPLSQSVDYHAVFLLCLRKTLLRMIVRAMQTSRTHLTMASMQRLSRFLIPWHISEKTRSILPGYPELEPLWKHIESRITKLPDITDTMIVTSVNSLHAKQKMLVLNTYQQWILRAKRMAQAEMGYDEWNTGFGILFRPRSEKG